MGTVCSDVLRHKTSLLGILQKLIAMSSAANELMWIKQLCADLSITTKKPTLRRDNKSANLLAVNPISSDRSKHIRVRHLRVREYVEHDEMDV